MPGESQNPELLTFKIHITGLIQGIGFRPFIYHHAKKHGLSGTVINQNNGVIIKVNGTTKIVDNFMASVKENAPKAAQIELIRIELTNNHLYNDFTIGKSETIDESVTVISPDIAVCHKCLEDMKSQTNRIAYPFTNCTNCGPRYSIISGIPYDRKMTSMNRFDMCPDCHKEYLDINDRRFHAQPIACNNCGPHYKLHSENNTITGIDNILTEITKSLKDGEVIAMKGLGGFHLVCDPGNINSVERLREIKARDSKPFAIMSCNLGAIKEIALVTEEEEKLLNSWQRPIVIVKSRNPDLFSPKIANKLKTFGLFLPYMPFHYQLFEHSGFKFLIMTSANLSNCPIIIDDQVAIDTFMPHRVKVLTHNREIINRTDDSVVTCGPIQAQVIRRSRGYAPLPISTKLQTEGILATGAELSCAFCIGKGKQAILSPYIGDIKNFETLQFYKEAYKQFIQMFKFKPAFIASDLHPDYQSTHFAEEFNLPNIKVQHHHAHIAACMAEFGIDEQVIGVSYDGTGLGTDGKIWGSEIMIADLNNFERKFHFEYIPIPGGDIASKEPWRSGLSYLNEAFPEGIPLLPGFKPGPKEKKVLMALKKNINAPESCSAGRLFDAVASITGICNKSTYHAEAPILLENSIEEGVEDSYTIVLDKSISWKNVVREIVSDIQKGVTPGTISAKFHNTVALVTHKAILYLYQESGINKIVLSGGTFQNKYLSKKVVDLIVQSGLQPFISSKTPCNDGGIALGQLAIAAKSIRSCV